MTMTKSEFHAAVNRVTVLTDGKRLGIGYQTTDGNGPIVRWEDGTKGPANASTLRVDDTKRLPSYPAQRYMLGYDDEIDHDATPNLIRTTRR